MPPVTKPLYIGDGVYVYSDGYHIVLETSNGYKVTNRVCLDSHTMLSFQEFVAKLLEEHGTEKES